MSLKQQLTQDLKTAMKARDAVTLGVIRFLMAEVKNVEIDKGEQSDDQIQKIVASQVKKMKEAIVEFEKGGRDDIVQEERAKIKILEKYLPKQMSAEDLEKIVREVVSQNQGQQPGPIIGQVMKKVAGQADGGQVAQLVNKLMK